MGSTKKKSDKQATEEEIEKFRQEHGISREVWDKRGYRRWYKNDFIQPVTEAYQGLDEGQIHYMEGLAKQENGYVIIRHAPQKLADLDPIYPEIRPDQPVITDPRLKWHWHGDPSQFKTRRKKACAALRKWQNDRNQRSKELLPWQVYEAEKTKNHVNRHKDKTKNGDKRYNPEDKNDHFGINTNRVHCHIERGKYTFAPTGKIPYEHDHEKEEWTGWEKEKHIWDKHNNNKPLEGTHEHTKKDPKQSLARRLDVHPLAEPLFKDATRVYFVIEGCIKADAVLTHILEQKRQGEAVFSVPSVTLWDAKELEDFVDQYHLKEKEVFIIPDADWLDPEKEGKVIEQARLCQIRLMRLGVDAEVMAPPQEAYQKNPKLKGIDDYLAAGGSLDDLDVLVRQGITPSHFWLEGGRKKDERSVERRSSVLLGLRLLVPLETGRLHCSRAKLARIMGVAEDYVQREYSGPPKRDSRLRWKPAV